MNGASPFVIGVPLDPRLDREVQARADMAGRIADEVRGGDYYLILAPAGGGRTTMLKALERELSCDGRTYTLLLRPDDLALTSEGAFFESLCALSDVVVDNGRRAQKPPAEGGETAFDDWLERRTPALQRPVTYLFDDIDLIPPNILQRLAGIAHGIFNERNARTHLKKVSFVFAGTISLRYLTLTADPHVSPFNVCKEAVLADLDDRSALSYLRRVVDRFELPFHDEGVERVVFWTGGDLNLMHRVAGRTLARGVSRVMPADVDETVTAMVPETGTVEDETLRRTILLVEEDRRTLQLVLDLLRQEPQSYVVGDFDDILLKAFSITYPELCGAVTLRYSDGMAKEWRFRHSIARRLAQTCFAPRRLVRIFAAYGEFGAALEHAEPVLARVREAFAANALDFEGSGFSDVLMALTHRVYVEAVYEAAYESMALVLSRAFGCTHTTYFDYDASARELKALKFLGHLFDGNDGSISAVDRPEHQNRGEVRAFRTGLFAADGHGPNGVRVSIPLKRGCGDVTSVVSACLPDETRASVGLALKVQLIQRALNPINMALHKVEGACKERIVDSARLPRNGRGSQKLSVFVAHRFNAELLANLRDHLGSASTAFEFMYPDQQQGSGLLLMALREAMERAGLALYEVSSANNNVYFEIGMGLALNLPGLVFCRRRADGEVAIPALLNGLMRLDYHDYAGLLEGLSQRLELLLTRYRREGRNSDVLHFLGVPRPDCGKRARYALVLDHNHFGDQRDYRKQVEASIPAPLKVIYASNPAPTLDECLECPRGSRSALLEVWLAVKHADAVIIRAEHFKDDARASQAFVGAGIAYGLQHPRIHMTFLTNDPISESGLEMPADLGGWTTIPYQRLSDLSDSVRQTLADLL